MSKYLLTLSTLVLVLSMFGTICFAGENKELDKANVTLDAKYKELLIEAAEACNHDILFCTLKSNLEFSQARWIDYKNYDCSLYANLQPASNRTQKFEECQLDRTTKRISDLDFYLEIGILSECQ